MTNIIPPTHNRSPLEVVTVTGSRVCLRYTQITPAVRWFPLEAVDTLANKDALDTVAPMQGCQSAETEALELEPTPYLLSEHWQLSVNRNDQQAVAMYQRHYSYRERDGKQPDQFGNPGHYIALMTVNRDALFMWSKEKFRKDGQSGINCAVFRNEGQTLSSTLVQEACEIAWRRWPFERLFTFVDASKIRSGNPGCCFKKAGFVECGVTSSGLLIFERVPFDSGALYDQPQPCAAIVPWKPVVTVTADMIGVEGVGGKHGRKAVAGILIDQCSGVDIRIEAA